MDHVHVGEAERPSGSQSQSVRSHIVLLDSMTDLISDLIMTADACTFPPSNCAGTHWDPYPTNVPTDILPRSNATAVACRVYVQQWDIVYCKCACAHAPCSPAASARESSPALSVAARSPRHLPFCARTPPRLLRSAYPCLWHCPCSVGLPSVLWVAFPALRAEVCACLSYC